MMATAVAAPAPGRYTSHRRTKKELGLELYLQEVARLPPLSIDEEEGLLRRSLCGDLRARDELIQRSLRLVPVLVTAYLDTGMPMLDLIEQGNLGLLRAAEAYHYGHGPFCAFAACQICLAIEIYLKSEPRAPEKGLRVF